MSNEITTLSDAELDSVGGGRGFRIRANVNIAETEQSNTVTQGPVAVSGAGAVVINQTNQSATSQTAGGRYTFWG